MVHFLDRVKTVLRRGKRGSIYAGPQESVWKRLPGNVLVDILASCELKDIGSMSLSCRLLHDRVVKLEYSIAWAYIQLRKQIHQQGHPIDGVLSPGDDIAFICELFPPPPPDYESAVEDNAGYSLAYLGDLKRCWNTCIRLSHHLADHVVEHHLETDSIAQPMWSSSKTEKELVYSRAVATLQAKLLHPMAYAIFFLEAFAVSTHDSHHAHHAHHTHDSASSVQRQQSILQKAPFTDTQVFLSTHHGMHLLFSTVRRLMGPEIPHSSAESWISLLLTTSTMERIVNFFLAVAKDDHRKQNGSHDSTWSHRKEFLLRMRQDLNDYTASMSHGEHIDQEPELNHLWFEAASNEMDRRGAIPHTVEDTEVHILHGSVVKVECGSCYGRHNE
ncbi:unnamed protein product [Penicillium olsonii]|nr:unnamed protein product [Penicillium olsonii]CAG7926951.1 unnamed protein product [Penicillium olsonii]